MDIINRLLNMIFSHQALQRYVTRKDLIFFFIGLGIYSYFIYQITGQKLEHLLIHWILCLILLHVIALIKEKL